MRIVYINADRVTAGATILVMGNQYRVEATREKSGMICLDLRWNGIGADPGPRFHAWSVCRHRHINIGVLAQDLPAGTLSAEA